MTTMGREEELFKEVVDMAMVTALSLTKYLLESTTLRDNETVNSSFVNKLIAIMKHHETVPSNLGMEKTTHLVEQVNKSYDVISILNTIKEFESKSDNYIYFLTKNYKDNIPTFEPSEEMSSIMSTISINYHDEVYVVDKESQYKTKLTKNNCSFYEIHEGNRISLLLVLKDKLAIYELFRLNHMNSIKTDKSPDGMMVYAVRIPSLHQAETIEEVTDEIHDLVSSMSGAIVHKVINPYLKED